MHNDVMKRLLHDAEIGMAEIGMATSKAPGAMKDRLLMVDVAPGSVVH